MTYLFIAALAALALFAAGESPSFALWLWMLVCGFVPFWVGITSPFYLCSLSVVGMAILAASIWRGRITMVDHDLWMALLTILVVACGALGIARPGDVTSVITQWVVAYLVARILVEATGPQSAYRVISWVFSAVAVGTIVEFLLDWNPYFSWVVNNVQFTAWGTGQVRGGIVRAEWAFGHSIALGCALGMAVPIIAAVHQKTWIKMVQIGLCGLAVVFTFSRAGLITAIVGLMLVLVFSREAGSIRTRMMAVAGAIVLAYFVNPLITSVYRADNGQATVSADYRGALNSLIATMRPFGLAVGYSETTRGSYSFGAFRSIDSTFVYLGVSFGYVVALIALVGAVLLVLSAVLRKSSAAGLGVVAVIPALFTVAPITQFGSLLFFYIGMTVAAAASRRSGTRDADGTSGTARTHRGSLTSLGGRRYLSSSASQRRSR